LSGVKRAAILLITKALVNAKTRKIVNPLQTAPLNAIIAGEKKVSVKPK